MLGKSPAGAETIESWWSAYSRFTSPALTPALVLAGRADEAAELMRLLEQDVRQTLIRARSIDDVLAFIAAVVLASETDASTELVSRTLVVRDGPTLRQLDCTSQLLILVPWEDHMRRAADQVTNHHVVFISRDDGGADLELPDPDHDEFKALLLEAGLTEERALELTRAAESGLDAFRRVAAARGAVMPPWSSHFQSQVVRRLWLLGSWNSRRTGDQEIVTLSTGLSFKDVEATLATLAKDSDPLFALSGGTWSALSVEDAWGAARRSVTSSDLEATEAALQAVLGEIDPALDLPIVDRWMAGLLGKSRLHSSSLRTGLATTVALMGSRNERDVFPSGQSGPGWAREMVSSLSLRANSDASGQVWASLSDVLPLLSEAAPDQFIRGIQNLLDSFGAEAANFLFSDTSTQQGLSISSPHTGLLWALEGIAWDEDYLPGAVDLLARLAEIDPGGRLSNRPTNSLRSIFLPWFPQTSAASSDRREILEGLIKRHPGVGWTTLISTLPENHSTADYTHKPMFRHRSGTGHESRPANDSDFVEWACHRAVELSADDPSRICMLIERSTAMPTELRRYFYTSLQDMPLASFTAEDRAKIWEAGRQIIRFHTAMRDMQWALAEDDLAMLATSIEAAAPADPVEQNRWLFDSWSPDLEIRPSDDHDRYDSELRARRRAAVQAIADTDGVEAVFRLLGDSSQNWAIGVALWDSLELIEPSVVEHLASDDRRELDLARGFVRSATDGESAALQRLIDEWSGNDLVQARIASLASEPESLWDYLEDLPDSVGQLYWSEFQPYGLGHGFRYIDRAAKNLIANQRPATAVDLVGLYSRGDNNRVDPEVALTALEALVDSNDPEVTRLREYGLTSALDVARSGTVDLDRLAILEWRLLPALGFEAHVPALASRLARDPELYVEMVCLFALPASGEDDAEVDSATAMNAYRLLQDWNVVPGASGPRTHVDAAALASWLTDARTLLREADRSDVGEQFIGHVLAKAMSDEDGTWPETPVRDAIEMAASKSLDNGFVIATLNARGATSRGVLDGGAQEHALVNSYRDLASKISKRWPRVAALLREIAQSYERDAAEQDRQAAARKRGINDER